MPLLTCCESPRCRCSNTRQWMLIALTFAGISLPSCSFPSPLVFLFPFHLVLAEDDRKTSKGSRGASSKSNEVIAKEFIHMKETTRKHTHRNLRTLLEPIPIEVLMLANNNAGETFHAKTLEACERFFGRVTLASNFCSFDLQSDLQFVLI